MGRGSRGSRLARANVYIGRHASYGLPSFVPVSKGCPLLAVAHEFQISTVTVALAASHFQRLMHSPLPPARRSLMAALVDGVAQKACMDLFVRDGAFRANLDYGPHTVVYALCLHIAVKTVHWPHNAPKRLKRYRLNHLLMYLCNMALTPEDLDNGEARILQRLEYKLLPLLAPRPVWRRPESDSDE